MHDIRAIRENPAAFDAALARRGLSPVTPAILALDEELRRAGTHAFSRSFLVAAALALAALVPIALARERIPL